MKNPRELYRAFKDADRESRGRMVDDAMICALGTTAAGLGVYAFVGGGPEAYETPSANQPGRYDIAGLDQKGLAGAEAARAYLRLSGLYAGTTPNLSLPTERLDYGRSLQTDLKNLSQGLRTQAHGREAGLSEYDLALKLIPEEGRSLLAERGFQLSPVQAESCDTDGNARLSMVKQGGADAKKDLAVTDLKDDRHTILIPLIAQ